MGEQTLRGTVSDRGIREIWHLFIGESGDVFVNGVVEVVLNNAEANIIAAPLEPGYPKMIAPWRLFFRGDFGRVFRGRRARTEATAS